jgi:hypothetical protein
MKEGKVTGYYLSALGRGPNEGQSTFHLAAFFDITGAIESAFRTTAIVEASGAFYPLGPHEVVWTKDFCVNEHYPHFFDAIVAALGRQRSEPTNGR